MGDKHPKKWIKFNLVKVSVASVSTVSFYKRQNKLDYSLGKMFLFNHRLRLRWDENNAFYSIDPGDVVNNGRTPPQLQRYTNLFHLIGIPGNEWICIIQFSNLNSSKKRELYCRVQFCCVTKTFCTRPCCYKE